MSATSNSNSLKGAIDDGISLILKSNFLEDSQRVCITTLLKIITTILNKPHEEKVRKLRLSNPTIQSKVVQSQGTQVLLVIGFLQVMEPPKDSSGGTIEQSLFLPPGSPLEPLHMARHQLQRLAIHQLKCPSDSLPKYNPIVATTTTTTSSTTAAASTNNNNNNFDVYQGSRFDAKSAAAGTNLGPPSDWKSSTYQQIEQLQKKQAKLESKLQKTTSATIPREWIATSKATKSSSNSAGGGLASGIMDTFSSSSSSKKEDNALLAQQLQKQQQAAKLEQQRGFTTKAMRDLERLKKQKVYSHCQLAIEFPNSNGVVVKGNFLPKESIAVVINAIQSEVLVLDNNNNNNNGSATSVPQLFDLYMTPPRTLLKGNQTLQELGLVPAAKIYISWKNHPFDIQPNLFIDSSSSSSVVGPSAPIAKPLIDDGNTNNNNDSKMPSNNTQKKKKLSKAEKEANLLKKMMGN